MKDSNIGWTGNTWNVVTGCDQIPGREGRPSGCDNCYAKRLNDTRLIANPKSVRYGVPFETVLIHRNRLDMPIKWKTGARIFVNSLSDLFHRDVPDNFICEVFDVMRRAQQHTFQILTKRPERMRRFVQKVLPAEARVLPNVHLGVSISTADDAWRARMLNETPAAVHFLSLEPLLGPIPAEIVASSEWVIVGGESGPGARPVDEQWLRDIVRTARQARVPVFVKQLGSVWAKAHRLSGKADDMEQWPDDLRLQEFPAA